MGGGDQPFIMVQSPPFLQQLHRKAFVAGQGRQILFCCVFHCFITLEVL